MEQRPEVKRFADLMEQVLRVNDNKEPKWPDCNLDYLIDRMILNAIQAKAHYYNANDCADFREGIIHAVVDTANFAMMIYDNLD